MNRDFKNDVFSMLMEDKVNALEVYNALNDSDYKDPEMLEIYPLEKGISLSLKDDESFIIDMNLNICEHQSTYCPNRPLKSLLYWADIVEPLVNEKEGNEGTCILVPPPRFVVFYNGQEKRPPVETLKVVGSFENMGENPELEATCSVFNINPGHDDGLLKKSKVLNEYTTFVEQVRFYRGMNYEYPVDEAISWCMEHDILKEFLETHCTEVLIAMTMDMSFEGCNGLLKYKERSEGMKEGKKEGIREGREQEKREFSIHVYKTCLNRGLSKEDAAIISEITPETLASIENEL